MSERVAARRAATRERILDAAWALAERDGIAGMTLRDLAREVGMRAPSLYGYFDGRPAILDAMFAEGYRQLDAAMAAAEASAPAEPHARVAHVIRAFLGFCNDSIPRYQLLFTRVEPGWEPSPEAFAVSVASYERMRAQYAELGVTDDADVDLLTAITAGLAAQQIANDPGGERWVRLADRAATLFLSTMGVRS